MDTRERQEALQKLADLTRSVQIAMLTTMAQDGSHRSRPMATMQHEPNGELWFFTQARSGKVDEIQDNHGVNVAYVDSERNVYVSVSGNAAVVRDRNKMAELWRPELKLWFPGGVEDPELTLLRIDIELVEYWDSSTADMRELMRRAQEENIRPEELGDHGRAEVR